MRAQATVLPPPDDRLLPARACERRPRAADSGGDRPCRTHRPRRARYRGDGFRRVLETSWLDPMDRLDGQNWPILTHRKPATYRPIQPQAAPLWPIFWPIIPRDFDFAGQRIAAGDYDVHPLIPPSPWRDSHLQII